jgi:hypothetical protein
LLAAGGKQAENAGHGINPKSEVQIASRTADIFRASGFGFLSDFDIQVSILQQQRSKKLKASLDENPFRPCITFSAALVTCHLSPDRL